MPHLTYLFRAYFADGYVHEQTPDDTARLAVQGSAFSDVLYVERIGNRLESFALFDAETDQPVAAVHLDTGHFEIGGNEFYAGTEGLDDPGVERRLIYYRQVTQTREMDVMTATMEPIGDWRTYSHTRYVVGWQATIAGRNVQHVIALDG